jgi:RNA-directed DNA polymerase
MASVRRFITTKLKLEVNDSNSAVARAGERKFLGFSFTSGRKPKRRIAPQAIGRFKKRVRELTRRTRGVGKDLAAQTAGSAHGPWRLANSPALAIALPHVYFDSLGLARLTVR